MRVTTRSRKVRSCDTVTTAAGVERHELLEQVEPGEVEVVGRLVEQQHVLARQQDGRQRGPCRLPARQVADLDVEAIGGQADLGEHRARAGVEVVAADGEEVLEGRRRRPRSTSASSPMARASRASRRLAGRRDARAAGQVRAQRLARVGVGLLRQEAHGRGRRATARPDRRRAPRARPGSAAASTSRCRSAPRCRAGPRGDRHRHPAEHHLRAVVALDVPRHEHDRRRYQPTTAATCGDSGRIPTGSATG